MKALFDFLDRHIVGVLATIVLHLFFVTLFLVVQMRSQKFQKKTEMLIDFSQVEDMQKEAEALKQKIKPVSNTEFIKNMQQEYLGHNIPVNEQDQDAKKAVSNMESDIKKELNISDNSIRDTSKVQKIEKPKEKELPKVEKKKTDFVNEKGEPSVFRGATTISYNVKGRTYMYIPTPQYQCENGGKVVLDITVNPKGFVLTAEVNKIKSQISEECVLETAIRAALTTRFNEKSDAPAKEPGTLTFVFVAQ